MISYEAHDNFVKVRWTEIPFSKRQRMELLKHQIEWGENSDFDLLEKWLEEKEITHLYRINRISPKQLGILLNTGCIFVDFDLPQPCSWYDKLWDHTVFFKSEQKFGVKFYMMCSPYLGNGEKLGDVLVLQMKKALGQLGIDFSIEDESWYYPGKSTTCVMTGVDDNILNENTTFIRAILCGDTRGDMK